MSIQKRVALCVLMSAGVLAGICGAVKTSKLPEANDLDVTWATVSTVLSDVREPTINGNSSISFFGTLSRPSSSLSAAPFRP